MYGRIKITEAYCNSKEQNGNAVNPTHPCGLVMSVLDLLYDGANLVG